MSEEVDKLKTQIKRLENMVGHNDGECELDYASNSS